MRGLAHSIRNFQRKQWMYVTDIFLKTPLSIYFNFFSNFFSKIWAPKLGVRLICECILNAGVYGIWICLPSSYRIRCRFFYFFFLKVDLEISRFPVEFARCVWTEAVSGKKSCGFKNIGICVDGAWVNMYVFCLVCSLRLCLFLRLSIGQVGKAKILGTAFCGWAVR